jgi:hypothetical protein
MTQPGLTSQSSSRDDFFLKQYSFLLPEDAAFITGQTLFVDGGSSVGRLSI